MKDRIIDTLTLQHYLEGTLDTHTRHELEKQALEDNFLADALEGYTYVIEPAEKLSLLQKRLSDRVLVHEANKKAFSVSAQRLSIAAAAGLMFFLAVILFWMNGYKSSVTKPRQIEVNLAKAPVNPVEGVKEARKIAKIVVAPLIEMVGTRASGYEPVTGWEDYSLYLQNTISEIPAAKSVSVSFRINSKGQPVNVKVVDGIPNKSADELLQAIVKGPLWKNSTSDEVRIRITYRD